MSKGDQIYVYRTSGLVPYQHHGIDMGDGTVVHLAPDSDAPIAIDDPSDRFAVRRVSMAQFTAGASIHTVRHSATRSPDAITRSAEEQIGQTGYNLLGGNCEHFATKCATGEESSSRQVDVGEATLAALISGATKAAWSVSSKLGTRFAIRSATKLHPAAILADGVEVVVLAAGCSSNMTTQQTKRVARISSSLTAVGVGAVLGGPAGAAIGLATHASSNAVADRAIDTIRSLLGSKRA